MRWVLIIICALSESSGSAAGLNPQNWRILSDGASSLPNCKAIIDNDLNSCVTNREIGIDFGKSETIDRVYLTGTNRQLQLWPEWHETGTNVPLGRVTVAVGDSWPPTNWVGDFIVPYDAGDPVDTEIDVRFSPRTGRFARIWFEADPGRKYGPRALRIAEMEIHGFDGIFRPKDAVILEKSAPAPLALAAEELSYYIGEVGGRPIPIVDRADSKDYSGTLYCIDDLKPLAPDYDTMMSNIEAGLLPASVNIERNGRIVSFKAWPYRNVLWSVWEFLERQGIRWVYPDAQGDSVPHRGRIDLSFLPLRYAPSAMSIYANWDASSLDPWRSAKKTSVRQGYLYPWRNRWNYSWDGYGPLGGDEIPRAAADGNLSAEYREGFSGYPHNFKSVIPDRILLAQSSDWWGYDSSKARRVAPTNESITFCMDNPEVIRWVASKVVAVDAVRPFESRHPLAVWHGDWNYNLLPMDSTKFCDDPQWCGPANDTFAPGATPYARGSDRSFSGEYYQFVNSVAAAVRGMGSKAKIGALAYADVYGPPASIDTFPENVRVEVCMYGAPNLPMDSPKNAGLRRDWIAWRAKCSHLATYDYALLHTDYWQPDPKMPVPLVAAIVDRARFLSRLGALNGGCQATLSSLPFNPWNFYAYPRIRWNTNQAADALQREFFTGYFREAADPMLGYYKALESYEIKNDVDLHCRGCCYGIMPGAFPLHLLKEMQTKLLAAEKKATNWVVVDRIAKIREGFNWILSERELPEADLTNTAVYPSMPREGVFAVNLVSLKVPKYASEGPWRSYASVSAAHCDFHAQGTLQTTLNFNRAGHYAVVVTARAVPYQGVYPILKCFLGPDSAAATITSTNFEKYKFDLKISPAVWDLVLQYDNAAPNGARNIVIKNVQIERERS